MSTDYRFLPKGLWPTFRWLAGYLKARGVSQKVFFSRAEIPWATAKHAAARPDRPLPYTPQWQRAIKNRQSLIKKGSGRKPASTLSPISGLDRGLLATAAKKTNVSVYTLKNWFYLDRIPDTKLGRAFYRELQSLSSGEKQPLARKRLTFAQAPLNRHRMPSSAQQNGKSG